MGSVSITSPMLSVREMIICLDTFTSVELLKFGVFAIRRVSGKSRNGPSSASVEEACFKKNILQVLHADF